MKTIPLSEPMGGCDSCCVHNNQCKEIINSMENSNIQFRCPLLVEVDDDIEYAGPWHESCFEEKVVDGE